MGAAEWSADFSYGYLKALYKAIGNEYQLRTLDGAAALAGEGKIAFIRHDIDLSIERALTMAKLESAMGIQTTYHVMIDNPFYRLDESIPSIRSIAALGHEVGLHYDIRQRRLGDVDENTRDDDIRKACEELERVLSLPAKSVSFHRPVPDLFAGPLLVAGRVNGYASELFRYYLSDSGGRWREGEPLESLKSPRSRILQILVHPIWWGERHAKPAVRLRHFLLELQESAGISFERLNDMLNDHIACRAEAADR